MDTTAANLLALEDQVCFALAVASRSVNAIYRPILEPYGLTHPQYLVMLALWAHSPRSVKELGAELQLEPATLSPLLKRLEASGLVARNRATDDERVLLISLTEAGIAGMSLAELDVLRTSLWRVIDAAQDRSARPA
jgi:DNA-binding MarR family transcriptional regulator